jgi:hypothetical protein
LLEGKVYFQGTVSELKEMHGQTTIEKAIVEMLENRIPLMAS